MNYGTHDLWKLQIWGIELNKGEDEWSSPDRHIYLAFSVNWTMPSSTRTFPYGKPWNSYSNTKYGRDDEIHAFK